MLEFDDRNGQIRYNKSDEEHLLSLIVLDNIFNYPDDVVS